MRSKSVLPVLLLAVTSFATPSFSAKAKAPAPPPPAQPAAPAAQPQPAPPAAPAIESGPSAYPTQCPPEGQRVSVAIYPIKPAGAEASLAQAMTALLASQLTPSPKLKVIEEAMLKAVMERQAMNVSDACDDTSCQVEIGKLVKAQKMISGDLVKFGSKFVLSLKLVDIQTGTTEFSTEDKCSCTEDQLDQLVGVAAAKVKNHFCDAVAIPQISNFQAQAQPVAPAAPIPGGRATLFIYFQSANAFCNNLGPWVDEVNLKMKRNTCIKKQIDSGNHVAMNPNVRKQINIVAQPGGTYYLIDTCAFSATASILNLVSEAEAASWSSTCQQAP